jgi:hypothetical protein
MGAKKTANKPIILFFIVLPSQPDAAVGTFLGFFRSFLLLFVKNVRKADRFTGNAFQAINGGAVEQTANFCWRYCGALYGRGGQAVFPARGTQGKVLKRIVPV